MTKFDFEGRDSLLNCKVLDRYQDLVRYINLYTDPATATEDMYHLNISIFRLLSDDPVTGGKVGIEDQSLDGLKNKYYDRSEFIQKLAYLKNFNYVYQKDFITTGAPYSQRGQTSAGSPVTSEGFSYTSPFYHFKMDYIENSIASSSVESTVRNSTQIDFRKHLMLKNLNGRLSKMILPQKYERYGVEYTKLYDAYDRKCNVSFDSRDTTRRQECTDMKKEVVALEAKLRSVEIKFQFISEREVGNYKKTKKLLEESFATCNCPEPEPPEDADGDGFSYVVDCNDDPNNGGASIYPGAPINCTNGWDDDNCDGVVDFCCEDKDGDGFYSSLVCDCDTDSKSEDLYNKCDCNDDPTNGGAFIYPGAPIDCSNSWPDDNCDGIKDTIQFQITKEIDLTSFDNIYPPYGLTNFGKDTRFYVYTGLLAAGVGTAIYFKTRSNKWYDEYESAETFRDQDLYYDDANRNHQRFLIASGFTLGTYLVSQVDLRLRYVKYNSIRQEIQKRNAGCALLYEVKFDPLAINSGGIGPALTLNF